MSKIVFVAALILAASTSLIHASNYGDSNSVKALRSLLHTNPQLATALEEAIKDADMEGIATIPEFESYINSIARLIPTSRNIEDKLGPLYIITDISDTLRESAAFEDWSKEVISEWGHFLDTPASIAGLSTFYDDADMKLDDYFVSPSGWMTFNQFFAREIKPGKRPIAGLGDGTIIVSPADAVYKGVLPITEESTIEAKGITHRISDLLADSDYAEQFADGQYTHMFLSITDYHRFHTPFAGKVVEKKFISGFAYIGVFERPDGSTYLTDGPGYQFRQQRGLIVLETEELGYVAILPIGMGPVSSVELTPDVGDTIYKGEEIGFFQFGGSDIVLLFQKDAATLTTEEGTHYLQGSAIGTVNSTAN